MSFKLTYKPYGAQHILVEWPSIIDEGILRDILSFKAAIQINNIESIVEIKNAYNSLLIIYDNICRNFKNEVKLLKSIYDSLDDKHDILSKLWKIPVCYDAEFGIDLELMALSKKLSIKDIVQCHSQAIYTVYFIGFLPGFLYLGGLDKQLHTPRKQSPRLKIEKGAVAIGGMQTGIYPSESPGGWHIIGNSPIEFFNVRNETPCFAKAGDKLRFYPINIKEYHEIKEKIKKNTFKLEGEVMID